MSDAQPQSPLREITQPFIDLIHAPRALWGLNLSYLLEGFAYFGLVTYLAMYFNQYVQLSDQRAGYMVGALTSGITFAMLFFGGRVDRWGVRRTVLLAISLMAAGRFVLALAPSFIHGAGLFSLLNGVALAGILLVVTGFGMYQPAIYAGTRQISTPATSGMAFAMLYAVNNLGGWLPTFMGPLRRKVGIAGGIGFYGLVSFTGLVLIALILSARTWKTAVDAAKTPATAVDPDDVPTVADLQAPEARPQGSRFGTWIRTHPLMDLKFTFFIFALIPVQTLFAYNWLVMPQYVDRAFTGTWIGRNFEAATAFNSLLIFILCPLVAALTAKAKVYRMMTLGTAVMGAAPFILVPSTSAVSLVLYILVLSIGEAMWQPRFLQYAAEIAPEGRTGVYMGVAQLPWFLTKMLVPLYSGAALAKWCPSVGPKSTGTLWLVSGCIAMASTTFLILARGWIGKDFKTKA